MKKIIIVLLCILWITFILMLSSDNKSNYKTLKLSSYIKNVVEQNFLVKKYQSSVDNVTVPKQNSSGTMQEASQKTTNNLEGNKVVKMINFSIRKSGHFLEYFILGIFLTIASRVFLISIKQAFIYILFILLFIANLDEFYQSFVGRTSMVRDCLIDFCGGTSGMLMVSFAGKIHNFMSIATQLLLSSRENGKL